MKKNAAYTSPYEFTGLILLRQAIGLSLIGVGATPLPAAAGPRTLLNRFGKKFESVDSITKYLLLWKKLSSDCAILFALCLTKSFPVSRAEIG